MKTLTVNWLKKQRACEEAIQWFKNQPLKNPIDIINHFIKTKEHLDWGNWLIVRLMTHKDKIRYAVFAAKQVLSIYEKKYPDDLRPRKAIEAAEKCLKYGSQKNNNIIAAANDAAYITYITYSNTAAAYSACAAEAAPYTAATYAAAAVANHVEKQKLLIKIFDYGLTLLK